MNPRTPQRREDVPFRWRAQAGIEAMVTIAGIPADRLFLEADAVVDAYTRGRPMLRELFGPDLAIGGPHMSYISYGHINCLGARLVFPENSEVAQEPLYDSLAEGVAALRARQDMDFTKQGMFPYFLDLWETLKRAFPDEPIPFTGFKPGGPLTDAWALRGHGFFTDLYDDPPLMKEFLRLVTAGVVRFRRLLARLDGRPEFSEHGDYQADDVAAMLAPALWPEFVMPFQEQYFTGLTSGGRSAHIEGLTVDHLHLLDELGLDFFDPSVSPKLTPALIRDGCRVPFLWRLTDMDHNDLTPLETERWVFAAAADGATEVSTFVWRNTCTPEKAEKVRAFIGAAKRIKALLAGGVARESLPAHAP